MRRLLRHSPRKPAKDPAKPLRNPLAPGRAAMYTRLSAAALPF